MTDATRWVRGGAAGGCPALWALRGTLGTALGELIEPACQRQDDGRCMHSGSRP